MNEFAEVWVDEKVWTYQIPMEFTENLQIGFKVIVPLRKKEKEGYVLRFVPKPEFKTLGILKIVENKQYFDEKLVMLCDWMAKTYKCFPETALKAIMPR